MLRRTLELMIAGLCSAGLMACSSGGDTKTSAQNTTLNLNRLASGDLQYCDAAGQCTTLPYAGECATIQVAVNGSDASTCQTCILPDGTSIDQGCGASAVACALVSLAAPACTVCAYVNGAVIYSTCTATQPACTSDADCRGNGSCLNGECVVNTQCQTDADCPAAFECVSGSGTCVSKPLDCTVTTDCPVGMECHVSCGGGCDPKPGTACPDLCTGQCEPV